jgi:hypothetical protein
MLAGLMLLTPLDGPSRGQDIDVTGNKVIPDTKAFWR